MKTNKALLHLHGKEIIDIIIDRLRPHFPELLIISNQPELYAHFDLPVHCDIFPNCGPLAGIHSGLKHITNDGAFFVACDMPFVDPVLAVELASFLVNNQAVVPKLNEYMQPLHAAYRKDCLPAIERALQNGHPKIKAFYHQVQVKYYDFAQHPEYNWERIFFNVNTPHDYTQAQQL